MRLRINQLEFHAVALASSTADAQLFYQGWHNWRQIYGRRKQLDDLVKGGSDRLDRSGYPKGGPTLLARPKFTKPHPFLRRATT